MQLYMINGPCGSGKTETSRLLHARISDSVLLKTDGLRRLVPETAYMTGSHPDAVARMWHANILGRQIAQRALERGRTTIVDSIKYQEQWVHPWEELGQNMGAQVLDVCLMPPKPIAEQRALERGYKPGGRLTPEKVSDLYDKVFEFYVDRPDAIMIDNQNLQPSEVVDAILAAAPQISL